MPASSTLQELEAFLLAADIGLTSANLSRTKMPNKPDVMTTLYEYQGPPDEAGFGVAGIKTEHPRIQVVCRGEAEDYDTPRLQLERIRQAMATIQAQTLSGTQWEFVTSLGGVVPLADDTGDRPRIACNFQVDKDPSRTA